MRKIVVLAVSILAVAGLSACQQKGGPLSLNKVEPPQGTTAGGEHVSIVGGGFEPGKTQAAVWFGSRKVESVVIASNSKINVVTPNGDKGPTTIKVQFDTGETIVLKDGFRYVEPMTNEATRKAALQQLGSSGAKPAAASSGVEAVEKK